MQRLSASDIFGSWATLMLATDRTGAIDDVRLSDEIDVLVVFYFNSPRRFSGIRKHKIDFIPF